MEKPNGDKLKAAIDKLRADRAVSETKQDEIHAGEDLKVWLSAHQLDPELEFFLMSEEITDGKRLKHYHLLIIESNCLLLVSGLLRMTEEDVTEKPDSGRLRAAIKRLRQYREDLQLNYDGDDVTEWLKVNDLPAELESMLAADGATTGRKFRVATGFVSSYLCVCGASGSRH